MELFSRFNEPQNLSTNFVIPPNANACIEKNGNNHHLKFTAKPYLKYELYENDKLIKEISNSSECIKIELDEKEYILKTSYIDENLSSEKKFNLLPIQTTFKKENIKKKWYL